VQLRIATTCIFNTGFCSGIVQQVCSNLKMVAVVMVISVEVTTTAFAHPLPQVDFYVQRRQAGI
jgi:hypothetical protein